MTAIVWDRIEDRRFETGIDRGVIYPWGDDPPVAWNGLTSVAESPGRESKVYYQDGAKVLIRLIAPGYKAKISAFTYPDVLDTLMGNVVAAPGVRYHDMRESSFDLCYRTLIGSALDGTEHGYTLHLVYGLVINPNDKTYNSLSDQPDAPTLQWDAEAVQTPANGLITHISIDSTEADPAKLAALEAQLYGTADADPGMPIPAAVTSLLS